MINFQSLSHLTHQGIQLSFLEPRHAQFILEIRSNPEVNKYIHRKPPQDLEEAMDFVHRIQKGLEDQQSLYWVIETEGKFAGTICLWNFSQEENSAEVGYELLPGFSGKGIMSKALDLILELGFTQLDLGRIEAFTHQDNQASIRLLQRKGFQLDKDKKDQDVPENFVYFLDRKQD